MFIFILIIVCVDLASGYEYGNTSSSFAAFSFIVTAAVDNEVWFYDSAGTVLHHADNWLWTSVVDYGYSCVIPLKLYNYGGPMGAILSTDHGIVTDSSWKCQELPEEENWFSVDFDDSHWPPAHLYGSNGDSPWSSNFGPDPILSDALWIWTDSNERSDHTVYCRKKTCLRECSSRQHLYMHLYWCTCTGAAARVMS